MAGSEPGAGSRTPLVRAPPRSAADRSATGLFPGLLDVTLDPSPVQLNAHDVAFCDARGTVQHLDVRFLTVAPDDAMHAVSVESLDVRWWPVDALPTQEPGIVELVRLTKDRLHAGR